MNREDMWRQRYERDQAEQRRKRAVAREQQMWASHELYIRDQRAAQAADWKQRGLL